VHRVVVHKFGKRVEFALGCDIDLAFRVFIDPVVVDSAFVSQGNASLARTRLTFPYEEAAVDSRAQQVLSSVSGYWSMVPAGVKSDEVNLAVCQQASLP